MRAPTPWNGPYQVNPPGRLQVREALGGERRLVYRPAAAIADEFRFTIEGPLELRRDDRPSVPNIAVLPVDDLQRWILLPSRGARPDNSLANTRVTAHGNAQAACGVRRFQNVRLRGCWRSGSSGFRARGFSAIGQFCSAGRYHRGLECRRQLLRSSRLRYRGGRLPAIVRSPLPRWLRIDPSVGRRHVGPLPKRQACEHGVFRWPHKRLPQRVEVLFRGEIYNIDHVRRYFEAPKLGDLPVRETLWTVIGPDSWTIDAPDGRTIAQPWRQEWRRMKNAVAALDSIAVGNHGRCRGNLAMPSIVDSPWSTLHVWHWSERSLPMGLARKPTTSDAKQPLLNDEFRSRSADRVLCKAILKTSADGQTVEGAGEILRRSRSAAQPTVHCVDQGQADSLCLGLPKDCPSRAVGSNAYRNGRCRVGFLDRRRVGRAFQKSCPPPSNLVSQWRNGSSCRRIPSDSCNSHSDGQSPLAMAARSRHAAGTGLVAVAFAQYSWAGYRLGLRNCRRP